MMRGVVLALALLTVVAAPTYARGHGGGGGHFASGTHGHVGGRHFDGHRAPVVVVHPRVFVPGFGYSVFGYAPACWWQAEYWINQPYVDRYGAVTYVPTRVPGQWLCQ